MAATPEGENEDVNEEILGDADDDNGSWSATDRFLILSIVRLYSKV